MSNNRGDDGVHRRVLRQIAGMLHKSSTIPGIWICLVVLGSGAVACSDDNDTDPGASESPDDSWVERAAAEQGSDGSGLFAGYTEDDIGTEILVDDRLARRHTLARYRTYEDADLASVAENDLSTMSPEARDRAYFEQAVRLLFLGADDAMPAEVSDASDELRHAFYRSLDLCVERSEWPEAKLYSVRDDGYMTGSFEEFQLYQQQYGMTLDEFIDFEHECNKFAASYPALDRDYRDELLRIRRDYYLEVLRLWMRDNPEMVVPMTYEQSVNHPYQDYVREVCLAADNPEECARQEGVILP